jgi:hypothetical protein
MLSANHQEPRQPFRPEIKGELRERLTKYAKAKGRSMSGAVMWLVGQGLTREGY